MSFTQGNLTKQNIDTMRTELWHAIKCANKSKCFHCKDQTSKTGYHAVDDDGGTNWVSRCPKCGIGFYAAFRKKHISFYVESLPDHDLMYLEDVSLE